MNPTRRKSTKEDNDKDNLEIYKRQQFLFDSYSIQNDNDACCLPDLYISPYNCPLFSQDKTNIENYLFNRSTVLDENLSKTSKELYKTCNNISSKNMYEHTILKNPKQKELNIFDFSNSFPLHKPQNHIPDMVHLHGIDTRLMVSDIYKKIKNEEKKK